MNDQNQPFDIGEAASYTGYKKSYIYKLIHQKKIPYYKPNGGRVFFKKVDLDLWIFSGRSKSGSEAVNAADIILINKRNNQAKKVVKQTQT